MMVLRESTRGSSLHYLLDGLVDELPDTDLGITGLNLDSREVAPGALFLACAGSRTSGVSYISDAIRAGAVAVAVEAGLEYTQPDNQIAVLRVSDLQHKMGIIAARFYGEPSKSLELVGITGTNGKTSISHYLAHALSAYKARDIGVIGTLGYGSFGELDAGRNTTPDAVTLQRTLAGFYNNGIDTVVMEVSSHGLEQGRVTGVDFNIGVFTNLSVEHLDYHGDMETYWQAKKRLFHFKGLQYGVINGDDKYGRKLIDELGDSLQVLSYGVVDNSPAAGSGQSTTVTATIRADHLDQIDLEITSPWGAGVLQAGIGGRFNAYNLLACLSTLCLLEVPFDKAMDLLSNVSGVPGRLECFGGAQGPTAIVDYAHTPDALEKVLIALRKYCAGELICVFGCGGDRDRHKRPLMGAIAERYADRVILTNDNPRNEDPQRIISDIVGGIKQTTDIMIEPDRTQAINAAIRSAGEGDLVLIAGKGHETYQEIADKRYPFSDRQLVRNLMGGRCD